MRLDNPLVALHEALSAALHRDLPPIEYADRDWDAWRKLSKQEQDQAIKTHSVPGVARKRRPQDYDVEVIMFPQTWGSTALGYGGIGGASMTPAYTVVVSEGNCHCVYFGRGELAYALQWDQLTPEGKENWLADLASHNLASRSNMIHRYKSKPHDQTIA